jgi:hypothetical protein
LNHVHTETPPAPAAYTPTAALAKPAKKLPSHKSFEPSITYSTAKDGGEIVTVGLFGRHGEGQHFTIDRADWDRLTPQFGTRFFLRFVRNGENFYVSTNSKAAGAASGTITAHGTLLARLIVGPTPGHVIRYADGNSLNLRRNNLVTLTGAAALRFKREHMQ